MLKINLTPEEELENPLWYVPDIAFAVLVLAIGVLTVQLYLNSERERKILIAEETMKINAQTQSLEVEVKRLEETLKELKNIQDKVNFLNPIVGEEVSRYLPIMALEHLQNLKPEGVWFNNISLSSKSGAPTVKGGQADAGPVSTITISGYAFDHIIVAEFLTAIRATQNQDLDNSDIRTQLYFPGFQLVESRIEPAKSALGSFSQSTQNSDEEETVSNFDLILEYGRREPSKGSDLFSSVGWFPVDSKPQLALK